MGQTASKRTSKGEVSIANAEGRIRLRWRYKGERYSLNLSYNFTSYNVELAKVTATQIKLDMLTNQFDSTLVKYQQQTIVPEVTQPVTLPAKDVSPILPIKLQDLIPNFNEWATDIRNIDVENTSYYLNARKLLEKWADSTVDDMPAKLNKEAVSASTYNDRLSCLRNFFSWLVRRKAIVVNPLEDVCRKKKRRKLTGKRQPLNEQEIQLFLEAIKNDTFCPASSRYKHSHYYSFFSFIFLTGVRNAEAIGLRVRHINFNQGYIEISEAFARTVKGTHHAARVRKGTKMENIRYLPFTPRLRELLLPIIQSKKTDDFVFPSPTGVSIDDHNLQRRIFKPVMKALGLGDKDLYVARHSFGSRAIEQGISPAVTAELMGNTVETLVNNYVKVINRPNMLPSM